MLSSVICAFCPSQHHRNKYFQCTYYVLGTLPCEVTDRAPYRAGRAVTEAETESSWLNRHTEGGVEGKEKALQRAEEESAGKTGLGGGGSRQRTARPGDPRVWNLGSQVGGRQGKALHTSAFYQSGQ